MKLGNLKKIKKATILLIEAYRDEGFTRTNPGVISDLENQLDKLKKAGV